LSWMAQTTWCVLNLSYFCSWQMLVSLSTQISIHSTLSLCPLLNRIFSHTDHSLQISQLELEIQGIPRSMLAPHTTRLTRAKAELARAKKRAREVHTAGARRELVGSGAGRNQGTFLAAFLRTFLPPSIYPFIPQSSLHLSNPFPIRDYLPLHNLHPSTTSLVPSADVHLQVPNPRPSPTTPTLLKTHVHGFSLAMPRSRTAAAGLRIPSASRSRRRILALRFCGT
jgi:hypothetical protein